MERLAIHDRFKRFLRQHIAITDIEFKRTISYFQPITLLKGDYFAFQNKICKHVAFIDTGLLRMIYTNDKGIDITSCFCTAGRFTTALNSFIYQQPSTLNIQAVIASNLLIIGYDNLQRLYQESPTWLSLGRTLLEKEYLTIERYASVLNNETAKEKYERLVKEQPDVIQHAPVQHIASYLGISRKP